jgi:c-di-GMP-binding flagellar brake protein YcgR
MYKGRERRKYRRVRAQVTVDIERYEREPMLLATAESASRNLSAGGLLVVLEEPVPVPSLVLARFSLPGEADKLEVVARATRCEKGEEGYYVGLEFLDSRPEETGTIEKYVEEEADPNAKS